MALIDDFRAYLRGDNWDNFHSLLIRLFMKADRYNYARLKMAFPNTERVVVYYRQTGELLDLPYDREATA